MTGTEQEQTALMAGIVAERDRKLQELAEKYQKEADTANKKYFEKQMNEEEAAEVAWEARLQQRFQDGLDSEAVYNMNLYDAKRASLEAQLSGSKPGACAASPMVAPAAAAPQACPYRPPRQIPIARKPTRCWSNCSPSTRRRRSSSPT